ncbi:MAG: hypothetical protein KDC42_09705 [Ignavibacteriae bacterium]|nr:hypothetical protein [Ignavibacteriota bacterium]
MDLSCNTPLHAIIREFRRNGPTPPVYIRRGGAGVIPLVLPSDITVKFPCLP